MSESSEVAFLCKRLKELREKNNCTMDGMVEKLGKINFSTANKSSISRVEGGKTSEKTLREYAEKYCQAFGMSELQTKQFLRGEKIAVPDTSALLKNAQLIDELNKEYSKVIIPKIVIDELSDIKNAASGSMSRKAWEVLRGISYGDRTIKKEYTGKNVNISKDDKIIYIAQEAAYEYTCRVDIITDDTDFPANLKGNDSVTALHLREYMVTKQSLVNMTKLIELESYFGDSYADIIIPSKEELNSYLKDGNTLIISAVINRKPTLEKRKAKIKWLIAHGADVNKRDCSRRYLPPISHAILMNDFKMFQFLIGECKANPNVGSRNPYESAKVRQKNEGNMPLMIAAYDGKDIFVEALCKDERTSINQQDSNGYTALMKACMNGNDNSKTILLKAGADLKIVDINGKTFEDHHNECLEFGPKKNYHMRADNNNSKKGQRW